ncbi:glutamate decarboxylase [Atractiella rhizophila]|nr:glutamate decarboxylase [Atractiella rhizophila]
MGYLSTVPTITRPDDIHHEQSVSTTVYGSALAGCNIPRFEMGEQEMPARVAARFVHDELLMDGNPALNLASFVTTYMEEEAEHLMMQNLSKNFIDIEEYPACGEIETRCVNMIARLFNAPLHDANSEAVGVSTIGSSEAIILSVLAAKRKWQHARRAAGKSTERPNIVMNAAVQVCLEKAARYLEVEEKFWYCKDEQYVFDPKEMVDLVDENTIMVVAILGTTYTGQYENVAALNDLLEEKNKELEYKVHIHVDAASGGFVAPFINPQLKWDFRLPLVGSINVSGHKYGLAYAGVGWVIWRDRSFLPEDILFTINYLGSPQVSFTLNFSKSAVQVIGQYYQFLRLGKAGYKAIMENLPSTVARNLSLCQKCKGGGLPLVAWRLKKKEKYDEFEIARRLRSRGWIVPAYTMAPKVQHTKLLRVVVREDFSRSRCETFLRDLNSVIQVLDALPQVVFDSTKTVREAVNRFKAFAANSQKHRFQEGHSLQGTTGKTHGVC